MPGEPGSGLNPEANPFNMSAPVYQTMGSYNTPQYGGQYGGQHEYGSMGMMPPYSQGPPMGNGGMYPPRMYAQSMHEGGGHPPYGPNRRGQKPHNFADPRKHLPPQAYQGYHPSGPGRQPAYNNNAPPRSMHMSQNPNQANYGNNYAADAAAAQESQSAQPKDGSGVRVLLVTGYHKTGKTSVAKRIAEQRQYTYVALAPVPEGVESADFVAGRFSPLTQVLEDKSTLKGIVIDDILDKYEPQYIKFLLEEHGLKLSALVVLTASLKALVDRELQFDGEMRSRHPESFEFSQLVEDSNEDGSVVAVVESSDDIEAMTKEALGQIVDVSSDAVELPSVKIIPQCGMVVDPFLVQEIVSAERKELGIVSEFPYSEPNYMIDYVIFARHGLLFPAYRVVPVIDGDKVSLIAYKDKVYIHLPTYRLLFELEDTSIMNNVVEMAKEEQRGANGEEVGDLLFSLEATVHENNKIYVSDFMLFGPHRGEDLPLNDRTKLLAKAFGHNPQSMVQLLDFYPVNEVEQCLEKYRDLIHGVVFKHPGGIHPGTFESGNFYYNSEKKKYAKMRIWGGVETAEGWTFECCTRGRDYNEEQIHPDRLTIPCATVEELRINDGHIIECAHAPERKQQKGKKPSKSTSQFVFVKRCKWQVYPLTQHQMSMILAPSWPEERFVAACKLIPTRSAQ